MNFVTSVFKKYINKNESNSTDNGLGKQVPGELPASTTAIQPPESLNKSDEEEFQDAATTSSPPDNPQQAISISSNTVTNQDIQSPEISHQQQNRFSSTSALTEPDSLDTSIIDSLDELQQDENFDESNLIDSIEIPHLIDGINEYEQVLQDNKKSSKEFIASESTSEEIETQIASHLEDEASRKGALEQLIRSVNETLVLNDSSLNNTLIKDIQSDLRSKELNHHSDTAADTDTSPEKATVNHSSRDSIQSNEAHNSSCNPTESMPQELSDGLPAKPQTTQHNVDQLSGEQLQPTTPQEKQFTVDNNLITETKDANKTDEIKLDNNSINENVHDRTEEELASNATDLAYERQETKQFEKLEELAANSEDTSSFKLKIDDILDYLVAKSTSPTKESKHELQLEPNQKPPLIEAVPPEVLLQEIASLPLPDDDDSPLETNKTFFRQDTGEFEAIEKQCLLDVQNEKKLSEVPEENSSNADAGEAVKQINDELESKLVAKNCEKTSTPVESPSIGLDKIKTNGEKLISETVKSNEVKSAQNEREQAEAILIDLMPEKFSVPQVANSESKTPVHEEDKTLCRQDTHDDDSPLETNKTFFRQDTGEFEAIEKQCLLDVQNEKKLSEVPEENSSNADAGEAVKQINDELESKLVAKNCEKTATPIESPSTELENKTNGGKIVSETIKSNEVVKSTQNEIDQSEAILLDLMAEKFSVLQGANSESKTPVQQENKTFCRQDTHEFEIMEKQYMLETQKEQNSDKLDKVSEILEDVTKTEDYVNDSSSSSADTVIAVDERTKSGVKEEVIQHNAEHSDKNSLDEKTLTEVVKESTVKTSAGDNCQIKGLANKVPVANESEIFQESKPRETKNSVMATSFRSSEEISASTISENPQVKENNSVKVQENVVAALNTVADIATLEIDNQIAGIPKESKLQDEVILKESHNLLGEGFPNSSDATDDKETLISSDNKLDTPSTKSDELTLENNVNQVDPRKKPVKPQFKKQNRKSETRNKAEVRPTVRANKPIPTQKIDPQNDIICKVGHEEDSVAKLTNISQCDGTNIVSKMKQMVTEYEKQISMQAAELERLRNEADMNVRHFTNTEMAFSDVFEKYEKSKAVIAVYRRNEDILLENIERAEEQLVQLESKCQAMKQQSMTEIRRAEYQVNQEKEKYKRDISKMQGQIKRLEIKASSLELALMQKNDECQALAALCDDITGRTTN